MVFRTSLVLIASLCVAVLWPLPASAQIVEPAAGAQYVSQRGGATLEALIEAALTRNGGLLAIRQRVAEAQGVLTQSGLRANPSVEAGVASGRVLNSPGNSEISIRYTHTFELGGKRDRRVEVATRNVELAGLETAEKERELKADVKTRFAEALAAARNLASAEQLYELNEQGYRIAQARTRQGEGALLDEGLLRVEVNRISSDRLLFTNQMERALLELKTLTGMAPSEALRLSGSLEVPKLDLALDQAVERALAARTDLKTARAEEASTEAAIRQARAEAVPNLVASAGYSHATTGFDQYGLSSPGGPPVPIRSTDNLVSGGVSIDLPLRNRNQGNIQAAVAKNRQAALRRQYLETAVRQQVQSAMSRYEAASKVLSIFDQGVIQQSNENLRVLRAAYDLGEIRLMDVINEQRRLIDTQRAYTELLREAFQSAVELERALGTSIF